MNKENSAPQPREVLLGAQAGSPRRDAEALRFSGKSSSQIAATLVAAVRARNGGPGTARRTGTQPARGDIVVHVPDPLVSSSSCRRPR